MIATIGTDPVSGVSRFTFGVPDLPAGISISRRMIDAVAQKLARGETL